MDAYHSLVIITSSLLIVVLCIEDELLSVDCRDFPAKAYLLTKEEQGNEWLRFHAIVPDEIDPDYFYQKYLGE
ncbi:MAG: hypothetical protein K0Q75_1154 [Anaerospora sp.]|nr:hypothetical protein [Anaerospora sp.]